MSAAETIGAIGGAIGGVGGLAGLGALKMQLDDRRRRLDVAHIPAEMREVLIDVVSVCDEVILRPRDYEWCQERLKPVRDRFNPLYAVVKAGSNSADKGTFAALWFSMQNMIRYESGPDVDAATSARSARSQEEGAIQSKDLATRILQRMSQAS